MTADTRMMNIVHDALRRDLRRTITALDTPPPPDGRQRDALGAHVAWMMAFVHEHHHGEDIGLWPAVCRKDPAATALVETMANEHDQLLHLIDVCDAAARRYQADGSDAARTALLAAVQQLGGPLLAHLDHEEREMLPVAAVALTDDEWRAIDQQYFVKPKSLRQLGFEGHWLLDDLDAERADVVVHQVPPVPRFVLVHGFRHRYRKYADRCWQRTPPPRTVQRTGRVEVVVAAPIAAVWSVVSDVTRTGEWSHECQDVAWIGNATHAESGAQFRGTNRAGRFRWTRRNEILTADAPRTLAWRTISTPLFPDSTEWRIDLEAVPGGTRIVQSFRVVRGSALLGRVYGLLVPGHRDRDNGLHDDLLRIGEVARAAPIAASA